MVINHLLTGMILQVQISLFPRFTSATGPHDAADPIYELVGGFFFPKNLDFLLRFLPQPIGYMRYLEPQTTS